jgi:hypothetical protein
MQKGNPANIIFYWHLGSYSTDWICYGVNFIEQDYVRITRTMGYYYPGVTLLDSEQELTNDVWHLIEISTFDGTLEVWFDGTKLLKYIDPQPILEGHIGLELWASEFEGSTIYLDNLRVCKLSAPFVSAYSSDQ